MYKFEILTQIIIMATNKAEALTIALKNYGEEAKYFGPYKYSKGKGNNFYEFHIEKVTAI